MIELKHYKGKKVLITGHTGFKGSWLSRILLLAGAEVYGYSLKPESDDSLFNLLNLDKNMRSQISDIREIETLKKYILEVQPEYVFHLAAQPLVRFSYEQPVMTFGTNIMGTVNILESLRYVDSVKSFINITTDKVYENKNWAWGYRESDDLCGMDPYSNSKSCSELITYSYRHSFFCDKAQVALSTARSGNVIGGGDISKDRIIPDCIRYSLKNEKIQVRSPHSIRPYQHVLDCLSGYLVLAEKQKINPELAGSYNFGPAYKDCVSTSELVNLFCTCWGNTGWEIADERGPHEANFLKLDCSLAESKLRWAPMIDIKSAVSLTVEWTKSIQSGTSPAAITDDQINMFFRMD